MRAVFGLLLAVFVAGGIAISLAPRLAGIAGAFAQLGVSPRVIEMLEGAQFGDGNGREEIYPLVIEAIGRGPLAGYGIGGDRVFLTPLFGVEMYVHNVVLEILFDFGYIAGSFVLLGLCWLVIRTLRGVDKQKRDFGLLCLGVSIKLFMSGSYLQEPYFFMFLGVATVSMFRERSPLAGASWPATGWGKRL